MAAEDEGQGALVKHVLRDYVAPSLEHSDDVSLEPVSAVVDRSRYMGWTAGDKAMIIGTTDPYRRSHAIASVDDVVGRKQRQQLSPHHVSRDTTSRGCSAAPSDNIDTGVLPDRIYTDETGAAPVGVGPLLATRVPDEYGGVDPGQHGVDVRDLEASAPYE